MEVDIEREALEKLKKHFGHDQFRTNQLEAIKCTLQKRDCLLILPTGAGKSLAFQLPSLITNQITVVITPLLSLAKDQVDFLNEHDIEAASWSSQTSEQTKLNIARDLVSEDPGSESSLKLLYTTPESLSTPRLSELLLIAHSQKKLCSLVIDEAHVVIEWGTDFRPSYLSLGDKFRRQFPGLPIVAVTASATNSAQKSICSALALSDPLILVSTFNRPELQLNVRYKELIGSGTQDDIIQDVITFIKSRSHNNNNNNNKIDDDDDDECPYYESGIVYCRLRSTCDEVARSLCNADIPAASYHAGLEIQRRIKVQQEWKQGDPGDCRVVVATIAFGMGIDRQDVRWILHIDPPGSLEGLYQEAGRAGRDGKPAVHVVYSSRSDLQSAMKMERGNRHGATAAVADYIMHAWCRRKSLLAYFDEKRGRCSLERGEQLCDVCIDPGSVMRALEKVDALCAAEVERDRDEGMKSSCGDEDDYDRCDENEYYSDAGGKRKKENAKRNDEDDDDDDEDSGDGKENNSEEGTKEEKDKKVVIPAMKPIPQALNRATRPRRGFQPPRKICNLNT